MAEAFKLHLPWIIQGEAYRGRAMCQIERKWFRIARASLREAADTAGAGNRSHFYFDGRVLSISGCGHFLAMPASGSAWAEHVAVSTADLQFLPLRLMQPVIEVSIWKGQLRVAGRSFEIDPSPADREAHEKMPDPPSVHSD